MKLLLAMGMLTPLVAFSENSTPIDSLNESVVEGDTLVVVNCFENSIDILAFEKRISEKTELFLIKNNTPFTLRDIEIRLQYKTPSGEMIHYREVTISEPILARSTKMITLDSFDTKERYFYINNALMEGESGYPFNVYFELLKYNVEITPQNFPF